MVSLTNLVIALDNLYPLADEVIEESYRITIKGNALNENCADMLMRVISESKALGARPILHVSEESIDQDELAPEHRTFHEGAPWQLVFGKRQIAEQVRVREEEHTILFLTINGFKAWAEQFDPLVPGEDTASDLFSPTTIRVHGLEAAFGGPSLWVLPLFESVEPTIDQIKLPTSDSVHGLIHTTGDRPLQISPASFALNWGNLDLPSASFLIRACATVLASCLVQEIRRTNAHYEVVIRGPKRIKLTLIETHDSVNQELLAELVKTVSWVYDERQETRHQLIMDRLSIDLSQEQSFLSGLSDHLREAFQQARDSYVFVILERKDAYHKEMREIMKDMRSQADLYAAKVRDLVGALTRDLLGALILVGFSLVAKFDRDHLQELIASPEVILFLRFLAAYFVLSAILQVVAHWRDASLAYKESASWLDALLHYTSRQDHEKRFISPLKARRRTLFVAMGIAAIIYLGAAAFFWYLPDVASIVLWRLRDPITVRFDFQG